mgnify:CR=1 FL=1
MTNKEFQEWKAERDKAIAGTLEEFTAYAIKMGQVPSDPAVFEIMYHKCRSAVTSLPQEIRQASHSWLLDHGYGSWA